uniref:Si:ch211-154o6.2 n=1 Tax=Cyprinus carpio TaxID=7962 RepID=A0A8C1R650_CYPCA
MCSLSYTHLHKDTHTPVALFVTHSLPICTRVSGLSLSSFFPRARVYDFLLDCSPLTSSSLTLLLVLCLILACLSGLMFLLSLFMDQAFNFPFLFFPFSLCLLSCFPLLSSLCPPLGVCVCVCVFSVCRCRMCGLTFCNKSNMQLHSKSHTEVKAHQCPHCSKSFANTSYLAQHIRIHSGAKPYTCSYCQKAFRQLSHLQQHTRNHTESKPHKCPHCTKSFANTSYLAQHVRIHTGVKPYTCNYCQKTFRQLSHLQQHQRYHTECVFFSCHLCLLHLHYYSYRQSFVSIMFLPLNLYILCLFRIHTGDRPYKCAHPGCEKSFTQLSNLQSHRRQHNKDKPYKCHHCNRGYVDAASLEVHLSTHTVKHDKLYSCGLCNRTYTSETYLMKHMRKHAPDMLPSPPRSNQQSHSPGHAGGNGSNGDVQSQVERSNAFQPVGVPCIFDLNQYKPVPSADVQYKTVSVSDISPHKDLCITVEASAIQVEHLNS